MHSALNGGSEIGMGARVSCKDYKGPILWQTEPREGFPEGIPIRSLAPHNTVDLKDVQGISKKAKESKNREGLASGRWRH